MDQQSKLSLENHPLIVDLRTARAKNAAALREAALEQTEKPEKDTHGTGFSVMGLVTGHTKSEKKPPAPGGERHPTAADTKSLADTGFF